MAEKRIPPPQASAAADPALRDEDRENDCRDPGDLTHSTALKSGPHNQQHEDERQHARDDRDEQPAAAQAEGGSGSGGANVSRLPRIRRSAHAIGS